eukprot:CAMPEP_0202384116 /NCGR_PEP_ID=MMETSP1127-20130417/53356_1 /ASSEMBLY_ACC=CAM_ASM_000462 /TAXON_ID=3047 /ORGANISM="Dunaliella tertiolecta, Strain CCMP1320" /LENGTH=84 /DNA_ID=CAMNT_0048983819 /DNA_START=23 /DNA_END=274 /DNA_ORIENTATION=+
MRKVGESATMEDVRIIVPVDEWRAGYCPWQGGSCGCPHARCAQHAPICNITSSGSTTQRCTLQQRLNQILRCCGALPQGRLMER